MSKFPTLTEMGIDHFDDITKYSLRTEGDTDVLKIYFRREKGSLLAKSKKFKFGRHVKTVRVDGPDGKYKEVHETSPFLLKALDELHQIVKHEQEVKDLKQKLLDDVAHLEKVMQNKIAELRRDIEKLS